MGMGCDGSDDTATRRGTGPRGQGARQVHGGMGGTELGPGEALGDPGSGSSPRAAPHGGPTWRTRHPSAQNLQCSTTHADPSHRRMAKNSWQQLLAATTGLNITGIDRAAGPAAGRAGAEHGPAPAGSEGGLGIHRGTAPPSTGGTRVQLPVSGWGRIPPGNSPPPVPVFPWRVNAVWGAQGAGRVPPSLHRQRRLLLHHGER